MAPALSLYPDLLCFSHLRWSFVFQRPQHLMSRFARERRVFFIEEPVFDAESAHTMITVTDGVHVVVPHLAEGLDAADRLVVQRRLVAAAVEAYRIERPLLWFYTPMALPIAAGLESSGIVFDCMDELSGFANAAADLRDRERDLLARADVVFTGGYSLYEAKRSLHPRVLPFPSSVDVEHFASGAALPAPRDQRRLARPRIGFCGVIDERMDLALVDGLAARRPDWQFVMVGPVVKIDPATLPRRDNLHYFGMKRYEELPAYLAGWDAAMLPFAHNDATRYISPTKTPEYLAAGLPVVSTSIRDVVRPYGERGYVEIADTVDEFCAALERALSPAGRTAVERARPFLATMSWDRTFAGMCAELTGAARPQPAATPA